MNKKFKLKGVNVELSKEKLQHMLKEYDKPKGEVKRNAFGSVSLFRNDVSLIPLLTESGENHYYNLSTISRYMAGVMDERMETKDVLNRAVIGYRVYYDLLGKKGAYNFSAITANEKHFKTKAATELATKLLNESKDMKDGIERMSK